MTVEIDINIGLLTQILSNVGLPVAGIDQIDNSQRDIIDLLLVVLAKQTPAAGRAAQAVDLTQGILSWRGEDPPQPGGEQHDRAPGHPRYKNVRRGEAEIEQQE